MLCEGFLFAFWAPYGYSADQSTTRDVCERKGDMILVRVSFYYGYVNTLTRCWRALVTCWAVHGMYEKSSRCSLVRVCLVRADGECALCVMRARTRAVLHPRSVLAGRGRRSLDCCTARLQLRRLSMCSCVSAVRTRGRCLYSRALSLRGICVIAGLLVGF